MFIRLEHDVDLRQLVKAMDVIIAHGLDVPKGISYDVLCTAETVKADLENTLYNQTVKRW